MRIRHVAAFLATIALVAGCSSGSDDNIGPTDPTSGNGTATIPSTPGVGPFKALFQYTPSATGGSPFVIFPFPTDLYFSGTTDGTLNMPDLGPLSPHAASLNVLDGFSTTELMSARFSAAIDPASIGPQTVVVLEVNVDNSTKATVGVRRPLVYGTDFTARISPTVDSGGATLEILPLKPLTPSSGLTNVGYLVILTNGLEDTQGNAATPDNFYQQIKGALPGCTTFTNASQYGICLLTGAHLFIADRIGVNPANVVLTFSFSTQSVGDSLAALTATTPAQPIAAMPTGLTVTQASGGAIPGDNANVWVGEFQVPYYLEAPSAANPTAPITRRWLGNPSPLDPNSREITRFNPLPVKTSDRRVPVLMTLPNPGSPAYGGGKPAAGWPVVIFAHGLGRVRTDMLPVANSYANAGFAVIAIDLPLHGITDTANPLYVAQDPASGRGERTFDADYINNETFAPGPDGVIDPSGFLTFLTILQNPVVFRDAVRQAAADFMVLVKSVPDLDVDGDGAGDFDPNRIHWSGQSGGSVLGSVVNALPVNTRSAYLNVPGGKVVRLLEQSPTYGPLLRGPLAQNGLVPGLALYDNFWRNAQTAFDAADPWNYIAGAVAARPVLLTQVLNDQVILNPFTQILVDAGGLTKTSAAGFTPVGAGAGHWVHFVSGDHGSLLNSAADPAVTVEMQTHAVTFAASGGAGFQVVNAPLLEP